MISRGKENGTLNFLIEGHFQRNLKVKFVFLNGNIYFLLQDLILRKKTSNFCRKHFFIRLLF